MTPSPFEVESGGPVAPPVGSLFGDPISAWRDRTRRELGVTAPRGAPIAGAGHQAFFWHPGILAKFVQARRVSGDSGAIIHLVVDHDAYEPSLVRVPVRMSDPDDARASAGARGSDDLHESPHPRESRDSRESAASEGALDAVTHRFGDVAGGVAAMSLAPFAPRPYDGPAPALASIASGLERARDALAAARPGARHAAEQVARALSALMAPWTGPSEIVLDSDLLDTTLGAALVESMRSDPARCAGAFNRALALVPHAARPLREGADPELPLWVLGANGIRERVTASRLRGERGGSRWLPRAFLLSAIARLGLCDRFVHGIGAKRYEQVTEAWFREWLGLELPPIDVASATLRLPLERHGASRGAPVTAETRRRAWWDPESLDGDGATPHDSGARPPGPRKAALVATIAGLPRRSPARRAAYRAYLDELARLRDARGTALARLSERAAVDRARAEAMRLAQERTWPFIYFDDASLATALSAEGLPSAAEAARGSPPARSSRASAPDGSSGSGR